jgi:PAS domain S-box-containing protein
MSEVTSESGLLDGKFCSTLINSIRGIFWEADPLTFRFSFVSPHAERILGYPVQQWINEPDFWRTHTHPDDLAWCSDYCRNALLKGEDHEFQYRMIAADGHFVWLHDIGTVVRTDDGDLRLRGIMFDITKNRVTEEKLRSEEELFQLAVQGANYGLWDWDLLTDEVYYSTRWKSMLGYAEEELGNHLNTWKCLIHPADRDATLAQVQDFLDGRLEKYEAEFRMRHKAGHYLTILSSAVLSCNAQGKAVRLVGTHVDITGRKQADEALQQSEQRFRILAAATFEGIAVSEHGRFIDLNEQLAKLLGYRQQELIGMEMAALISPDEFNSVTENIVAGRESNIEHRMLCKDGSYRIVEAHGQTIEYMGRLVRVTAIHDITERKQTEEAIRQAKDHLRLVIDAIPAFISYVDKDYRYRMVNRHYEILFNKSREEISGSHVRDLLGEPAWDKVHCYMERALAGEQVTYEIDFNDEIPLLCSDNPVWHSVTYIPDCDKDGRVNGFVALVQDISRSKQADKLLRGSEERLRAIFETSQAGIIMIDPDGRIAFANDSMAVMLGCPLAGLIGSPYLNHLHPEERESDYNLVNRLMNSEIEHTPTELHFLRCDGSDFWGYVTSARLKTESGASPMLIAMVNDITERKKAEQNLKASEERYSILFNNIHDAVFIHDLEGRVLDVNQTMLDMYGVSREESRKMSILDDFSGPGNPLGMISEIWSSVLEGKYLCFEWNARRPHDDSCFPVEVCLRRISFGGDDLILANVSDMTEKRRMQDEMVKSQKLESLGMLAGGIAHDFNNILTAILGNLSFVRHQMEPYHIFSKRLEECENAVSRASELTRQLLTFSRGGEPVKKLLSPVSLIVDAVSFALRGSNVRCVTELADDLWCLEADEGQLSQVLHNLMLNAAQAMPDGGEVTVRAVNELMGRDNPLKLQPGAYITITVNDHGCGIPRENLIRIFDPYFTTKPNGSGLGLSSAYSIVKRHGGDLEVFSIVGEGSNFAVRLPASPDMCPEEEKTKKKPQTEGSGRILIMDDEEMIREIAAEILEYLGYEVESCTDGREAVERFRSAWENKHPFSAIILDLTIPGGIGGRIVAPLILEIDPDAVLIVSSGYSNDPVIANYRDYGFSGVINKPFDVDTLGSELENLLKGKRRL